MIQTAVKNLVDEALALNESLYLIDLSISENNKVQVVVDGDTGVPLSECIRISRNINDNLDREEEDFSLEVTTPDIAQPIKVTRQYIKNINRVLTIRLKDNTRVEGMLKSVSEGGIELEWKAREPKPIGKGKITVVKKAIIPFVDILEAKVKVIF